MVDEVTVGQGRRGSAARPSLRSLHSSRIGVGTGGGVAAGRGLGFSDEVLQIVAARARMLGEPVRVRLLVLLDAHDQSVQQLADRLGLSHQTVSKHLNVLYLAGMVNRRKQGREVLYALVDYVALWVVQQLANSAADHAEQLHEIFTHDG